MFQRCDNKTTMKGRVVVGRSLSESGWCEPDTKPIMKNLLELLTEILDRKVDLAGNFAVTRRTVSRYFISVLYK